MKKNKVIQIRITENDRKMINSLYDVIDDFNLSGFLRQSLRTMCEEKGIDKGIGQFTIG